LNGSKRQRRNSSALSCSKLAKQLQNRHELLVRNRRTSMGLMKNQQHFNWEVLSVFLLRFWKEVDLHAVHCPGCEQGAHSRQFVHTWRNKTCPLNYTFIVEEFFCILLQSWDKSSDQILKKKSPRTTQNIWRQFILPAGAAKIIEADFDIEAAIWRR
jgi:hypothetical protein